MIEKERDIVAAADRAWAAAVGARVGTARASTGGERVGAKWRVGSLRIGLAGLVVVCWLLCWRVDNGWQIVTRFAALGN